MIQYMKKFFSSIEMNQQPLNNKHQLSVVFTGSGCGRNNTGINFFKKKLLNRTCSSDVIRCKSPSTVSSNGGENQIFFPQVTKFDQQSNSRHKKHPNWKSNGYINVTKLPAYNVTDDKYASSYLATLQKQKQLKRKKRSQNLVTNNAGCGQQQI